MQINRELLHKDAPIGVFDSGIGGLTVAREIMRNLPSEKIVMKRLFISAIRRGFPMEINLRKLSPGFRSR